MNVALTGAVEITVTEDGVKLTVKIEDARRCTESGEIRMTEYGQIRIGE